MGFTVDDITKYLDLIAPFDTAEAWDNVGLLVGDRTKVTKKILLALDISEEVVDEAIDHEVDLIISHHPVIFKSLKYISSDNRSGRILMKLIQNNISVIAAHTNLDVSVEYGINGFLADCYGLKQQRPMSEAHPFGVVGEFEQQIPLESFLDLTKGIFKVTQIKCANMDDLSTVKRLAICSGASADFIEDAINTQADLYVTSDIKYHEAQAVIGTKMGLVDVGHFESEVVYLSHLKSLLNHRFNVHNSVKGQEVGIQILVSKLEKPIFSYR